MNWADVSIAVPGPSRALRALFLLGILAAVSACGAPGSDAVFTKAKPKTADSARVAAASPPVAQVRPSRHRGHYRRLSEDSRFRPCGAPASLEVTGTSLGRSQLNEQFRWNSVWQGMNMFGVFEGMIVTDTVVAKGASADSAAPAIRTRFFITAVESLRTWEPGDCNGMRVP